MSVAHEQQPLLTTIVGDTLNETPIERNEVLLDFEPGDADNPREWAASFKWAIVLLLTCMAFTISYTCTSIVPIAGRIVSDLDPGTPPRASTRILLVTIWELGEVVGPLFIAPFSEVLGRYRVITSCNLAFIIAIVLTASSQSVKFFIAARMLTGFTVSTSVLNPAIIGDMFESDQRGSAISLIIAALPVGGAAGPAISAAIAHKFGWRWMLLFAAALAMCYQILLLTCFRETYKITLLRRRAARLQHRSGGFESVGIGKESRGHETLLKLRLSITRPFAILFGSSVLMLLVLLASVAYSYFFVISVSLPVLLEDVYEYTSAQVGSTFISLSCGSLCGLFICHWGLDRIYIKLRNSAGSKGKPEYRLPITIASSIMLSISITAYGWIAQLRLPVALLLTSVFLIGVSIIVTLISISTYIVDACGLCSASAMTGCIAMRSLMGTFLPLMTGPLAQNFGYGFGFTFLGGLSMALVIIPISVFRYGSRWRQRSEFTRDM